MIGPMAKARANGIEIEWDSFGERTGEPILLVMGLGAQMLLWDEEFCQRLADRGHWVVRFDNRDVGLSTWFDAHGVPNPMQLMMDAQSGKKLEVPYSLDDMADDAIGLCGTRAGGRASSCSWRRPAARTGGGGSRRAGGARGGRRRRAARLRSTGESSPGRSSAAPAIAAWRLSGGGSMRRPTTSGFAGG